MQRPRAINVGNDPNLPHEVHRFIYVLLFWFIRTHKHGHIGIFGVHRTVWC